MLRNSSIHSGRSVVASWSSAKLKVEKGNWVGNSISSKVRKDEGMIFCREIGQLYKEKQKLFFYKDLFLRI